MITTPLVSNIRVLTPVNCPLTIVFIVFIFFVGGALGSSIASGLQTHSVLANLCAVRAWIAGCGGLVGVLERPFCSVPVRVGHGVVCCLEFNMRACLA